MATVKPKSLIGWYPFIIWWNARIPKWICQTPNHDFLKSYQTQFGVWICHKMLFSSRKSSMLPGANIVKSNLEFEYAIKMLFCHENISIMPKIIIIKSNLELWMCFKIDEYLISESVCHAISRYQAILKFQTKNRTKLLIYLPRFWCCFLNILLLCVWRYMFAMHRD